MPCTLHRAFSNMSLTFLFPFFFLLEEVAGTSCFGAVSKGGGSAPPPWGKPNCSATFFKFSVSPGGGGWWSPTAFDVHSVSWLRSFAISGCSLLLEYSAFCWQELLRSSSKTGRSGWLFSSLEGRQGCCPRFAPLATSLLGRRLSVPGWLLPLRSLPRTILPGVGLKRG